MTTAAQIIGRIERDLALLKAAVAEKPVDVRTGWRRVRGSHGDSYVRDPEGVDEPPAGYA